MKLDHSLRAFVCLAALSVAAPAFASGSVPPPPPPSGYGGSSSTMSCLYARVDAGGAFHEDPTVTAASVGASGGFAGGSATSAGGVTIEDNAFIEGGVGCQVTESLRADITGGVRLRQSLEDSFDTLDAKLRTFTVFANIYYDITNYAGWTPYIGGGAGIAIHKFSDVNLPVEASYGTEVNFAWNVQAGLSYDFSPAMKVDFGYRLTDLGKGITGGAIPFEVDDLIAHEFKVGLRYHFGGS